MFLSCRFETMFYIQRAFLKSHEFIIVSLCVVCAHACVCVRVLLIICFEDYQFEEFFAQLNWTIKLASSIRVL